MGGYGSDTNTATSEAGSNYSSGNFDAGFLGSSPSAGVVGRGSCTQQQQAGGRGLHTSTFQLNVSRF